jgi:hypothetical protein
MISSAANCVLPTCRCWPRQTASGPSTAPGKQPHNLNGQLKARRCGVSGGIVDLLHRRSGISGTEILVFDIDATPREGGGPYSVQFKREFVAD